MSMVSIEEARDLILSYCRPGPLEVVPLSRALGRALAQPVIAEIDIPPFPNSAMDGYAVVASDTVGASEGRPVVLRLEEVIRAGTVGRVPIRPGSASKIMTGAPLPAGADAVVEIEAAAQAGADVLIRREVAPGENVRLAGEDSARGELVFDAGTAVGAPEVGVLASLGRSQVLVHGLPTVAVLATGSELVEPGNPLGLGQIYNSNAYTAEAQCREIGLQPTLLGIAPDDFERTVQVTRRGLEHDVLITSGGVSVGDFDLVKEAQESLGVERMLWRVAVKPGKPLAFGVYRRSSGGTSLVFGVPGNPAASMVSFELFIRPALLSLMGYARVQRPVVEAELAQDQPNSDERVHVVRVVLERRRNGLLARSTGPQGSGRLRAMVGADGLAFVPPDGGGRREGDVVRVMLLGPRLI